MRLILRASPSLLAVIGLSAPASAQTIDPAIPPAPIAPLPTGAPPPTPGPAPALPGLPAAPGAGAPTSILLPPGATAGPSNTPLGTTAASSANGGERLSLRAAIDRAVSRNPTAAVAHAEAQRAAALEKQARSAAWPTLTGNGIYTRLDDDRVLSGRVVAGQDQLSLNATLTIPVFAPRAWASGRRAGDNTRVAEASAAEVRRQVAVATGRAYLSALTQLRAIEIGERARATAQAHLDFAHTRLQGGVGNKLDEVRASQEVAAAEAQVQGARLGLARSREALAVLLGSETPVDISGEAQLENPPAPSSDPNAPPEGLSRRTDVIYAQERVRAADRAASQNWTEYAPTLSLLFQPFYQNPPTLTLPKTGWQAQAVLVIPFYDGGLRYGVIAERRAAADSARESARSAMLQVRSDDRVARESVARAEATLAAAQESARLAEQARQLSGTAYQAGATTNLEIIDAERRARDAATSTVIAEDALRQARFDWMVAAGKFP